MPLIPDYKSFPIARVIDLAQKHKQTSYLLFQVHAELKKELGVMSAVM